ncbi:glycosyltransferase family 2 protein [Acidocella sp.]|uniref:glycosyltransferase family 2 protein n=1 Tax=Acidocella sp. TaxID=50710 RepID=UPI003D057BA7
MNQASLSPPAPAKPLTVAAIIPLHNGARFIEAAIRGVLAQTHPPDEFLVIDDGSTDNGPDIAARCAQETGRLRVLRKPNGGQSSARNFGVAHCGATHIAFLDQDDIWYPEHLERLSAPFKNRQTRDLGWCYSDLDEIDEFGNLVCRSFLKTRTATHPKHDLSSCLKEDMFILPSASLISRQAFEAVGGFDEKLCGYEDDDLFLRLFRAGYANIYLDEPLSQWRLFNGSTSYSPRMSASRMIYASKLLATFPDDQERGRFYTSAMIAPRFSRDAMADYRKAVFHGTKEDIARTLENLLLIARFLPRRRRLVLRAAKPLLRRRATGRMLCLAWRAARRLRRR